MLKVKSITTYPKKIGRSLKKKALLVVVASIAAVTLIACGSDTSQSEDYGTNVTALEMEIDRLNRVIGQKDKEIGDLHCTEEKLNRRIDILGKENDSLKEKNASSNETIDSLTKKNEELQAKIEGEVQTSPVTNSIPKDYAKRIFYNEDGYLDVDSVGDAFQFTGVEDYQMEYHNPWENGYIVAVNPHKMGDYFVELAKDGVGYLVSATDYTDVKISGVEFGKVDDLYTLVYCPYYDSKNGGKDSPEGYSGYILNIKNKDNVKDQRQTIYDFDTFEVLARDVILEDTSLFSYHWACDYKHIYIDPYLGENDYEGEYNCTILRKGNVNYLVDYSTFEVLAVDVKGVDCKFDDAGVRRVTITHANGKQTIYLNGTLQPIETDVLTKKLTK